MSKLEKNESIITVISVLFTFFYYGLGCMVSYGPDIYYSFPLSIDANVETNIYEGRLVLGLVYWLLMRCGQSFYVFYYASYTLAMLFTAIALQRYGCVLLRELSITTALNSFKTITIGLLSCMTIANIFYVAYFLFPNSMCGWELGFLLCVEASCTFIRALHAPIQKKHLAKIWLCLSVSAFAFDIIPALFIILTIPFILTYSYEINSFLKNQLIAGLLYGIAMIEKFIVTVYIVSSPRASFDKPGISKTVLSYTPPGKSPSVYILDRLTYGMIIYVVLCIIVAIYLTRKAVRFRRFFEIAKGLYITSVTVGLGCLPYFFRLTNDYKPRIYYPLGTLFGVLILYGILSGLIRIDRVRIIPAAVLLLAATQFLSHVQIFVDQYITNYEDKYISEVIGEYIAEYEEETEYTINYVVFYSDAERKKYAMDEGWCLTQRAYDATWSRLPALNYYLDETYEMGVVDDNLATYFSNYNWDTFSDKQIVFYKDTIHVCCY